MSYKFRRNFYVIAKKYRLAYRRCSIIIHCDRSQQLHDRIPSKCLFTLHKSLVPPPTIQKKRMYVYGLRKKLMWQSARGLGILWLIYSISVMIILCCFFPFVLCRRVGQGRPDLQVEREGSRAGCSKHPPAEVRSRPIQK